MPGRRFTPDEKAAYFDLREKGYTRRAAADRIGCNVETGERWEKDRRNATGFGNYRTQTQHVDGQPPPDPREPHRDPIPKDALKALDDFELFRSRYLGHVSTPWQTDAAAKTVEWLKSPDEEFVVVNVAPGCGKSTLFTHDLPLWLICRNRAIRIFIGSRTMTQAEKYTLRIRRSLERTRVYMPPVDDIVRGLAAVAQSTLPHDYGRFKPEIRDLWRADEFVVEQLGGVPVEDKESTVTAWGMDSSFLGSRADLIIWDDLVDKSVLRSIDQIEAQREWWANEAETRLEPGGVLLLVGQRMGANDLYRHALDMAGPMDEDDEDDEVLVDEEVQDRPRKYRHVIYAAHDDTKCLGKETHSRNSPPWPKGCLLDPRRRPWRGSMGLSTIRANRESTYRVQYQQEDVDPEDVLVNKLWIDGGLGPEGIVYPGCWDDRNRLEVPQGLAAPFVSVLSVDPSPDRYWGIQWWLVHHQTRQRFLMDLLRKRMSAADFLSHDYNRGTFTGVAEEMRVTAANLGHRFTHMIFEDNAAQKFFLQMPHVQRWASAHHITLIAHTTHAENKNSQEYGIDMLQVAYKHGLVRLPKGRRDGPRTLRDETRGIVMKLIAEVTRYPECDTADQVMAQWFLEHRLERLLVRRDPNAVRAMRPSWAAPARLKVVA